MVIIGLGARSGEGGTRISGYGFGGEWIHRICIFEICGVSSVHAEIAFRGDRGHAMIAVHWRYNVGEWHCSTIDWLLEVLAIDTGIFLEHGCWADSPSSCRLLSHHHTPDGSCPHQQPSHRPLLSPITDRVHAP